MSGAVQDVGEWFGAAFEIATLGIINPTRPGVVSPGVFGGEPGAARYGQSLAHFYSFGFGAESPEHQARERADQLGENRKQDTERAGIAAGEVRAAKYLAENPLPQSPQDELAARRRAEAAGGGRSGERRASRYLASNERTLGGA